MKVNEESEKSWLKIQHSKNKDHDIWSHHFMANRWGKNDKSRLVIKKQRHHFANKDLYSQTIVFPVVCKEG